MSRKLFTSIPGRAAGIVLYVCGAGFWWAGLVSKSPRTFFSIAGMLLILVFLWTFGWIWMHPGFRRSRRSPYRRYSDHLNAQHSDLVAHAYARTHPERRKRRLRRSQRRLRWLSVAAALAVFLGISAEFVVSYKDAVSQTEQMRLAVYLMDSDKVRTRTIATTSTQVGRAKEMMLALATLPTRQARIRSSDREMVLNVLIRNSGDLEIENAHVLISSNLPIKPAGGHLTQVAETELRAEVDDLPAFRRTGAETAFPVEISVPESEVRAGLFVTVLGEGMQPYSAAAKVNIVKQPDDAAKMER